MSEKESHIRRRIWLEQKSASLNLLGVSEHVVSHEMDT